MINHELGDTGPKSKNFEKTGRFEENHVITIFLNKSRGGKNVDWRKARS
jgi:hypothetical protein